MADPCELKFWKAKVLKADGDDLTMLELPNPSDSNGARGNLSCKCSSHTGTWP